MGACPGFEALFPAFHCGAGRVTVVEVIERERIVPVERVVTRPVPVPVERVVQQTVTVPHTRTECVTRQVQVCVPFAPPAWLLLANLVLAPALKPRR